MAMNVHYCGDEIVSVSINANFNSAAPEKNCCGIAENRSHCCKNKVVHFEKKTDQATVFTIHVDTVDSTVFETWRPIAFIPFSVNENDNFTEYSIQSHAPPFYKLYSQYVFYDRL